LGAGWAVGKDSRPIDAAFESGHGNIDAVKTDGRDETQGGRKKDIDETGPALPSSGFLFFCHVERGKGRIR
jgi:hypothetical protein